MKGTVVGILRGGPSREHDVSLKTGHAMLNNLSPDDFTVRDIYIDRQGVWHERGQAIRPDQVLNMVDTILLGLHGEYGEDGEIQKLLELHGIPYAGSDSLGSAIAMHKILSKERAEESGIRIPRHVLIESPENIDAAATEIVRTFPQPVIVKPIRWGSSVGVTLASGYAPLVASIQNLFLSGADMVMVEELIRGTEVTVGVVEKFRGEDLYVLPPVQVMPPKDIGFLSYETKCSGKGGGLCPAHITKEEEKELGRLASEMHKELRLRHYSASDFIISPRGIYYLETNTLPGMTNTSLLPRSLKAVGASLSDFFTHLVNLSLNRA